MDRTERLLDLVALLLDAPEPVSFADLREAFPDDYGGGRESAERKLERDKAELLQLGVPLEFVPPGLDDEREVGGYRIDRAAFFLPDPRLLPEEAAATRLPDPRRIRRRRSRGTQAVGMGGRRSGRGDAALRPGK